jgi:hypothetical protein
MIPSVRDLGRIEVDTDGEEIRVGDHSYTVSSIASDVERAADENAPKTTALMTGGATLGSFVYGARGALLLGIIAGIVGFAFDEGYFDDESGQSTAGNPSSDSSVTIDADEVAA